MSTNEVDIQSVPAEVYSAEEPHNEYQDAPSDDEGPLTKSGVTVDVNALMQSAKFKKGQIVHMSVTVNGVHDKGIFRIHKARYNDRQGACEYQLADESTGKHVYDKGRWYRESSLKPERR
ncbi:hypothetical protein NX059_003106 [Plenodomus lindquistii]|nr:hypothetical protein NX059_003106 [Plenodomus lindquistii]